MTVYSKYNIIYRLQKWLDSVPGQTFMNYAYSWGAAVVILGTLFKLTHLPGANFMLYLGMGTEVFVFFIAAFDRPFDKSSIDKELPTHVDEEDGDTTDSEEFVGGTVVDGDTEDDEAAATTPMGGGTIIIGGGYAGGGIGTTGGGGVIDDMPEGGEGIAGGGTVVGGTVVPGSPAWLQQQQQVSPEMEEAQNNYVEELKKLTEMLSKVSDQSERLTRDSEEMENLNRTLTGICKVYEMQLKGASAQIGTIDQINEQSRHMAEQIAELNKIYARMIEAMTVNMKAAGNAQ